MRKLFTLLGVVLAFGAVSLLNAMLYAAEPTEGEVAITEEELTPAKEPLIVEYIPIAPSPAAVSVKSLLNVFKDAGALNVTLQEQNKAFPNGGGSVKSISIKAFHDGAYIYFLLEWTDATEDGMALTPNDFRDAVGLMFPVGKYAVIDVAHPFSPRMGDRDKPVNIWHWKADWEKELNVASGLMDIGSIYPAMHDDYASDTYNLAIRNTLYTSASLVAGGLAAGNILSLPNRGRSVEDLNAIGFGTLTTQEHQDVLGNGVWKDGLWHVLITRPLTTTDPYDVQFIPGDDTVFNVAAWDGSNGDRNGQKNISTSWHPIKLEMVQMPVAD
ncbi:MAG TPA: ethylbenzene dehydrogenase-related protein [Candidatus Brocadiia bacterium]|nr:hypothetical protein [Planctomycetota bacterium]MBI4007159.1 hypothetical protein [Planctomycetota bacterium]MDO8094564.1 ethylbenzene dehydrogenase-related protein [Candidatus Brocadiales bacterium]